MQKQMQQDGERLDDIEAEQSKLESKLVGALSVINEPHAKDPFPTWSTSLTHDGMASSYA